MSFSLTVDPDVRRPFIESAGGEYNGVFSFKGESPSLYPFSSALEDFIVNDDGMKSIGKNKYAEFLENVPTMQIRAYYPNTVLNEIFSLLGKMELPTDLKSFKETSIEQFFNDASDILKGLARPNASFGVAQKIANGLNLGLTGPRAGDAAIIQVPYALYYRLVTTKTNAAYEIPCQIPSGFFDSDGNYGWGGGDDIVDFFNAGGFLKRITGIFHLTMMPFFTPGNGGETETLNVKIDLINDSQAAAEANYRFIQTLILNNKWLQYGITQMPGSLYDVKIPGGQRFFMCTGNFKVSYKGVLRSVGELGGSNFLPYTTETRIPDAYSLDLTFKNLLPSNLNNYLFGIAKGGFELKGSGEEPGVFSQIAENLVDALKGVGEDYRKAVQKEKEEHGADAESGRKSQIEAVNASGSDEAKKAVDNAHQKASEEALRAREKELNNPSKETLSKAEDAQIEAEGSEEYVIRNNRKEGHYDDPLTPEEQEQIKTAGENARNDAIQEQSALKAKEVYNETFNKSIDNSSAVKEAVERSNAEKAASAQRLSNLAHEKQLERSNAEKAASAQRLSNLAHEKQASRLNSNSSINKQSSIIMIQ